MVSVDKIEADLDIVFDNIEKDRELAREVYTVIFDVAGNPYIHYTGNWMNLSKASALLNLEFIKQSGAV